MSDVSLPASAGRLDALEHKIREFQSALGAHPAASRNYFPVLSSAAVRKVLLRNRDEATPSWYLNFASSNYLNLSVRPEVIEAGQRALAQYGAGANGAPILSGQYEVHEELQEAIARYHGAQSAALFPSGYVANLGVISAVCGSGDLLAVDAKAHASIIDGAKLSRVRVQAFPHNDVVFLQERVRARKSDGGIVVVATETLFSMDGDICPLPEFVALRERFGMRLLLDDAHAVGVLGARGRGGLNHFGLPHDVLDFHVGTFSKTFAGIGGYVVGRTELIDFLKFQSRSSLFSANIPPAIAACCLAAIRIAAQEGGQLAAVLRGRASFFRAELARRGIQALGAAEVPIVPVVVPDEERLICIAQILRANGILANMVRFPAVPRGESRLRFVLNLGLTEEDLVRTASLLAQALQHAGDDT
jgi:8-amino-7-oxononanoate synthase